MKIDKESPKCPEGVGGVTGFGLCPKEYHFFTPSLTWKMENAELVLSLQFYCAYSWQEIYSGAKLFHVVNKISCPEAHIPRSHPLNTFLQTSDIGRFPIVSVLYIFEEKKSGKFDFKTRLIEITFCGFWSTRTLLYFPLSVLRPLSVRSWQA